MNEIGRKIVDKLIELYGSADFKIAFLPYKRSMWNSMESVYEECKTSGIDAHCMPIPYIRMKEGHQGDYLDTDKFLFGDIAEPVECLDDLNPDFIAIHYQYEDKNRVTNMLPKYFTKALKDRYNCKIVYLPYGIGSGKGGFAIQPGCRYVDYAFLEDQNNADRFIAAWLTQGVNFSGRVFAFGSPKFDAAHKTIEKIVPDEWADIIKDKSVTLIVNSLGAYLSNPYQRIILYTQAAKNEINIGNAVIFRPHPLLRTTIKSMRPETGWRYEQMCREFKELGVIVDESEYLERAMSAADILVSDPSSVLAMWRDTGKPWRELV